MTNKALASPHQYIFAIRLSSVSQTDDSALSNTYSYSLGGRESFMFVISNYDD